jgi:hypothetical protein
MELDALDEKHRTTAQALLGDGPQLEAFMAILQEDFKGLRALLRAISFGAYSARVKTTLEKPSCGMCQEELGVLSWRTFERVVIRA